MAKRGRPATKPKPDAEVMPAKEAMMEEAQGRLTRHALHMPNGPKSGVSPHGSLGKGFSPKHCKGM